jgi:rhodanese-related sulfurtransferase
MMRLLLAIFAVYCALPASAQAAGVTVEAGVDRTQITIGDLVDLRVTITADTTLNVVLPNMDILLGVFEVKEYNHADPFVDQDGRRVFQYQYNLTTWTTGRWLIPPLTDTFTDLAGNAGAASSDSIFIDVKSLLAEAGADTVDIRDLKAQYSVPAERAMYYYFAAAVLLAVLAVWYILRRRKKGEQQAVVDVRTPHERAIDELNTLNNSGYLAAGQWREWYFDLTEIYRRYLDGRYDVETLEATTPEVRSILPKMPFSTAERDRIIEFLESADWVKFAKLVPPQDKPREDFDWVWEFVQRTKREAVETAAPEKVTKSAETGG